MFRYFLKYIGLLSLTSILVVPSVLNLGLYRWQRSAIKQEVKSLFKAGLKPSEISHFHLSQEELEKLEWEESHEFIYQGRKYDLISQSEEGGLVHIQAWLDDKESALRDRFHQLLKKHLPSSTDTEVQLIDLFKGFHQPYTEADAVSSPISIFHSAYQASSSEEHLSTKGPPPRFGWSFKA